jgi:metal-sulfur cluster biosynthetic enzyme
MTAAEVEARILQALAGVEDPCMAAAGHDLSIIDLGLVRDIRVDGSRVEVEVTFTEVGCAFTHHVMDGIHRACESVPGIDDVQVAPTWQPTWSRDFMNDRARTVLGDARQRLSLLPTVRTAREG